MLIHLLSSATHTHTRDAQAWPMHGWLLVWSPPPRPLCPTITHTHSGTGGVGHGGAWWCACALCVPPTPPSHSPSLPPPPPTLLCHHRPHTHGTWCMHHCHTHATCTTTHTKACCVLTTPCHTHHHPLHPTILTRHMAHTHGISHTATMVLAIAHHAVHAHTQLMPHTHHTGDRPRPSTPLAVAFREPPPPRWSCPFALLSSSLLVHQSPSLSHKHALTRPSCAHHHHHAIHPVCGVWGWTAPSTTVVVKHATHTLVDHCVDGSHHATLHPPSTLTPFCAFATTNHHAIPLLQPPPPHTTRPLCSSTAHSSASHTHMMWMACAFVAALTSCVWCVWMACTSHHIVHTATTTVALPIATPPLFGVCVCMETCAT